MKKALAALLMMPVIALSQSNDAEQVNIPAYCVSLKTVEEFLDEHDELPMIRGKSHRENGDKITENSLVLFFNSKQKTWTLIERTVTGKYCIIGMGSELEPVPNDVVEKIIKQRERTRS